MNMPLDAGLRSVSLEDKYKADSGTIFLTGTQALVRLPLMQHLRDARAGKRTAGYISGYRGSPLGVYDQALWRAGKTLAAHHVKFVPGLNEDLAATALWGTQQANLFPGGKYDGVFGIWYGKGPGVDRCGDVFRHANQAGTAPWGGVLALAGDDAGAKSSTMAAQTDYIFTAVSMPVLQPASIQDYLDLGLHGFALSRYAGLWVGFKCVTDSIETAAVADASLDRISIVLPEDFAMPPDGVSIRWPEDTFPKLEERLVRYKLPAALAYAKANRLDRRVLGRVGAKLGFVASGKAYLDLMQALADLGLTDPAEAERAGIAVFKLAMVWPLEPSALREFADGLDELFVVEEKRGLIESQIKEQWFGRAGAPRVVGKLDEHGQALVPEYGELSPALLAPLIAKRLAGRYDGQLLRARLAELQAKAAPGKRFEVINRIPYFCSGCPHNSSTKVPEGSRALAGIGCHYMAQWMDRSTATFTHMGGEGAQWVGQAPFVDTPHVFQNIGDGTYNHSGSLAIRHAVGTNTRITYKILFNDAVAMTGGQIHDGQLTPQAIARQMAGEGVRKIVVVTDEPHKYPSGSFAADVTIHHRAELDRVQRDLREFDGVSVLIYDQTCASEKRRRRKRGAFADPNKRAFINESVCEGCGDCSVQSNCVSVEPVETEFGRKRAINQSSCNKDFSCVNGFCPSFVTVEGGRVRRGKASGAGASADASRGAMPALPDPPRLASSAGRDAYSLLVTGIGGTGVITIGQILGMAAHLEGKAATVLDMAGLAQKGGAVTSFIRFAADPSALHAARISTAAADALIGCDMVVSASADTLNKLLAGRSRAVINASRIPTADFASNPDWKYPAGSMQAAIADACGGADAVSFIEASRLATALLGDAIATNLFMLGVAYQRGLLPVSAAAIERAIELNEVAIDMNKQAFAWGRRAAVDAAAVDQIVSADEAKAADSQLKAVPISRRLSATLDEAVARRVDFLSASRNDAWAERYRMLVERARALERKLGSADAGLADAVARNFFKLMAYKDEYEVARLYTSGEFEARLAAQFEGDYKLTFHLAPPLLARRNERGELVKRAYGPWVFSAFKLLARLKFLRGTAFDPFGYTRERRAERALIDQYEAQIGAAIGRLEQAHADPGKLGVLVELARLPERIRGYGHVKEKSMLQAEQQRAELIGRLQAEPVSREPVSA